MNLEIMNYFDEDFQLMAFRITLAVVLCGLIGLERELNNHSAGLRTHILVGVGSSLMMILSLYGFEEYMRVSGNIQFDPARIPSYVISGIGFLGAGTIMVHGMTIKGLTTAASIWTVAGIGLVTGAGMYAPAVFTTVVVLLSLFFLNRIEKVFKKSRKPKRFKITINGSFSPFDVFKIFEINELDIKKIEVETNENGKQIVYVEIKASESGKEMHVLSDMSELRGLTCEIC